LETTLVSGNRDFEVLRKVMGGGSIKVMHPEKDMNIRVGKIYLDTVHSLLESESDVNFNDFSIVFNLEMGEFKSLFTDVIGPSVSDKIVEIGVIKAINYLKVPHHGSKNGLTKNLLFAAQPEVAVISVGKNQWGHPNTEILDLLQEFDVKVYRTDQSGEVVLETDGQT
jgi:beta-lactamase superfamily II metal-dependent hydrolase